MAKLMVNVLTFAFSLLKTWDKLCPLDSDGDGFTNGEELGDPQCVWKLGAEPERTDHITHPGVCTPFDSEICRPLNICGKLSHRVMNPLNSHDQSILITVTTLTILVNVIKFFSNQEIKHLSTYGRWPWN
ncbi:hypothetical protein AHF37_03881 [Paragonimus kellicotti]|nr:hypothetical protein AHF37_03881 [Paragonimus kellicotti]